VRHARVSAGYREAVARTERRAVELLSCGSAEPSAAAAQQVAQALDHPGTGLRNLGSPLQSVRAENLPDTPLGFRALPLLVIGQEMLTRFDGPGRVDMDAFADALTALLVTCHREPWNLHGHRHVTHVVREYLSGRGEAPEVDLTVPRELLHGQGRAEFAELVDAVPWLRWWAPESEDPPGGRSVDTAELVELLVLVQPCTRRRYVTDTPAEGRLPGRFRSLYRYDIDPETLERLALALGCLLADPGRAATRFDALSAELPEQVRAAAAALVGDEVETVTDLTNMLAVRVDDATTARAVFLNLSRAHQLLVPLPDGPLTLGPMSLDDERVSGYCSPPQVIDPRMRLSRGGREQESLDVPMPPMATMTSSFTTHFIPVDVFRGRQSQLSTLRMNIQQPRRRVGNLIYGPRRAGKSTLMDHACQDNALRWSVFLDVANSEHRVTNFAEWNRETTRNLVRRVRRRGKLPDFEPSTEDFVTTLQDLDAALDDGGKPVAVALDELDVLFLPEQGSDGRRAAGRLGNLVFDNLVVIGTAQRFHSSVHELKNWNMIDCPADLTWADGVTYFFGPLHKPTGPPVRWLTWAGVTPLDFTDLVFPVIGLRPYFWGQLRHRLERVIRDDPAGSRLAGPDLIRAQLADLVANDSHLNLVTDRGELLSPSERRLKDFFSDDERRILLRFATLDRPGSTLTKAQAEQVGGAAAIAELLDRAYLTYDESTAKLRIAVRVYEDFLRARLSLLREVIADGAARGSSETPPARRTAARSGAPTPDREGARRHEVSSSDRAAKARAVEPVTPRPSGSASRAAKSTSTSSSSSKAADHARARASADRPASAASTSPATSRSATAPAAKSPTAKAPNRAAKTGGAATTAPTRTGAPAQAKGSGGPTGAGARSTPVPAQAKGSGGPTGAGARSTPVPAQAKGSGRPAGAAARSTPAPKAAPRPGGSGSPNKAPNKSAPLRVDYSPPTEEERRRITRMLRAALADEGELLFSAVGNRISNEVPRIGRINEWSGAQTLTEFFRLHLTDFVVEPGDHDTVVRLRFRDRILGRFGLSRG
jgi:hypothetical protein